MHAANPPVGEKVEACTPGLPPACSQHSSLHCQATRIVQLVDMHQQRCTYQNVQRQREDVLANMRMKNLWGSPAFLVKGTHRASAASNGRMLYGQNEWQLEANSTQSITHLSVSSQHHHRYE
eukprot:982814-Pelagomonas_calceolata.AAC.5